MMKSRPGAITRGAAADHAALSIGYSASGASEHSRQIAHSTNIKGYNFVAPKAPVWTRTDLERLGDKIAEQARFLAALHMRLRTEPRGERRAKILRDIGIKSKFLERLKQEQCDALHQK